MACLAHIARGWQFGIELEGPRPEWGYPKDKEFEGAREVVDKAAIAVIFVIDVSFSMDEVDGPTRQRLTGQDAKDEVRLSLGWWPHDGFASFLRGQDRGSYLSCLRFLLSLLAPFVKQLLKS